MSKELHALAAQHTEKVNTALAASGVSSILLGLFKTLFLPILPSLILALAPQIVGNAKSLAVLRELYKDLGQLPGVKDGQ